MATGAAQVLIVLGAAIFGVLGSLHLAYTFFSDKFLPRERGVIDAMKGTSPVLTRETTMWDAWIGFNASHSLGAILLAVFYLLLATQHMEVVAQSKSFILLAVAAGAFYLWLAHAYWFRVPFVGIAVATACFAAAFVLLVLSKNNHDV
jgi:uncharacterized membrane protein YfcA